MAVKCITREKGNKLFVNKRANVFRKRFKDQE